MFGARRDAAGTSGDDSLSESSDCYSMKVIKLISNLNYEKLLYEK